jgi:hypothetical protein
MYGTSWWANFPKRVLVKKTASVTAGWGGRAVCRDGKAIWLCLWCVRFTPLKLETSRSGTEQLSNSASNKTAIV